MKVTIQAGIYTYRIASKAVSEDGVGCFEKRLLNELSLVKSFGSAGTAPLSLSINIRNNDWYIPAAVDLWAATVVVEANNGHKWAGKVTAFDSDSGGVLYIIATEKTAPELSIQIPDEVARVVTLDENFHVSAINVTLPYVLGGNVENPILVKGILIDKTRGIYLLAVGENRQVVKVYRGTEELSAGFTAYVGTAGQVEYPGICYVQIDESLRKNDDGSYVEISADIVGLKLGSHTAEECRNGARQLLWLLKTAKDGVGGWGLGISESEINLDAFTESISRVDAAGLKSDGIMYFRQEAIGYIDQICKAIRGRYRINADGKRSLFVDAPAASVKTYSPALKNMKLLRFGKGAYTGRVFNKGRLEFGYNPLTSMFMQTVSYQNSTSIAAIDEQEFLGQSYFLRDMASAQAILDYTCKKSQTGAEKVYFEALELPENASDGQIITVNYPEMGISGDYQITHLEITDFIHTIDAERFSAADFTSGTPGAAINWIQDPPVVSPVVPGVASGLALSSEVRPSPDGTNIVVIKGSFTPPAGSYIAASIEWGEGILPILSWNDRGMMQGSQFEIAPVKPAQAYAVRIRMVTATGKSNYITGTITTEGDTVPPGKPAISATSSLKNVSINLSLASVPSDMAGFQIFRNTTNNSGTATRIGYVESSKETAQTVDINTEYGSTYYYWAKAVDTWGNPSVFSDAFGPLTISMILNNDVSPEAIKQAIGSVASWSAKNCTTASIAEVAGVKDVSGNSNHGRAYGGVEVVDTEMGRAFSFDGADDYIEITNKSIARSVSAITMSAFVYRDATDTSFRPIIFISTGTSAARAQIIVDNNIPSVGGRRLDSDSFQSISGIALDSGIYHIVGVLDYANAMAYLYVNGILVNSGAFQDSGTTSDTDSANIRLGRSITTYFLDQIFDPRIYSRALSATEVKSLYMFPGDVAFGRITSDLVTTGELITLSAQIANAIINDAHINNLNAAKINAGFIDVDRIENDSLSSNKINVTAMKAPAGAVAEWSAKGATTASIAMTSGVKDISGNAKNGTAVGGVTVVDSDVGKAFNFDGTDDYILTSIVQISPISMSIWVKITSTQASKTLIKIGDTASSTTRSTSIVTGASGKIQGYTFDGEVKTTDVADFPLDAWTHVVVTATNSDLLRLYVNGVFVASVAIGSMFTSGTSIIIGRNGTVYFGGQIAQPRIYNRALTATEIKTLYMLGTDSESGTITADRVVTGQIKSTNYSTTAGSLIDLDSGDIKMGGSTAPRFSFTNSTNSGTFAGFSFNAKDMTAGSSTTAIGISTDTAKRAFWAGGTTPTTAPFQIKHDGTGKMAGFAFTAAGMQSTATFSTVVYDTIIYATTSGTANGLKNTRTVSATNYSYVEISAGGLYAKSVTSGNTSYVQINGTNLLYAGVPSSSDTAIATNGKIYAAGSFFPTSDERCKSDIVDVSVLDGVKKLKVKKYHLDDYKIARIWREKQIEKNIKERNMVAADSTLCLEPDIENYNPCKSIGVLAADFNTVFNIGNGNIETYNLTDGIGVALRAIQELAEIVDEQNAEIAELRAALSLSPKPKKEKPEIEELTDEEREYIRLSEELTDEQREQIWREYERHMDSKK